MGTETRSPLKARPLRSPGESVEQHLWDVLFNSVMQPLVVALFLVVLAIWEWWRYVTEAPYTPRVLTAFAVLGLLYAIWRIWRAVPKIRQLRQARDGERAVGQYLERLRQHGYQVFHDLRGQGFNVDHVVIGPAGVFSIETKTLSKPVGIDACVHFDGEQVRVGGHAPDRDPVVQAKAQARWLRELLRESTGQDFSVRPVILFPGWFVEQSPGSTKDVWVLEPKALPGFLEHEEPSLTKNEISMAAFHLSRFIRAVPWP